MPNQVRCCGHEVEDAQVCPVNPHWCSKHCIHITVQCGHHISAMDRCRACTKCKACCECVICQSMGCNRVFSDKSKLCANCQFCGRCCDCKTCTECRNIVRPNYFCRTCSRCLADCRCVVCPRCDSRVRHLCTDCNRCTNYCCTCNSVFEPNDHVTFWPPEDAKVPKSEKSSRYMAAEIEVSHLDNKTTHNVKAFKRLVRKWKSSVVSDGSISGREEMEINTSPAKGKLFIQQIKEYGDMLSRFGARANRSCGLHIHLDARDFSYFDIYKLALLYQVLEPAIFRLVPASRRSATWCKPCGNTLTKNFGDIARIKEGGVKAVVLESFYGFDLKKRKKSWERDKKERRPHQRYQAVNLHSWCYRGSIEIRLAAGTVDSDDIINWSLMWERILNVAQESSVAQITKMRSEVTDLPLITQFPEGFLGDKEAIKRSFELLHSIIRSEEVREWIKAKKLECLVPDVESDDDDDDDNDNDRSYFDDDDYTSEED